MSTDPRFDADMRDPIAMEQKRSKWTTCLIGCLVIFGVFLIALALFGFWVARHWRDWASSAGTEMVNQGLEASELPPAEKAEVKVQVKRVADAFREGRLSIEQMGTVIESIVQSPLMPAMIVMAADKQYLEKSGLSAEEKAEGRVTLHRLARGMIDGEIGEQQVEGVMEHVADRRSNGQWQFRQHVSDADLKAALAEAKRLADEAQIPEEPEAFDPSEEFRKIIDDALGEDTAGEEMDEAPEIEVEASETVTEDTAPEETAPVETVK